LINTSDEIKDLKDKEIARLEAEVVKAENLEKEKGGRVQRK